MSSSSTSRLERAARVRRAQRRLYVALALAACDGTPDPSTASPADRDLAAEASAPTGAEDASTPLNDGGAAFGPVGCSDFTCSARTGAGCDVAARLSPSRTDARTALSARGSTSLEPNTSESSLFHCRDVTRGPDVWYALDLGGFSGPIELHAAVDAGFDAVIELRRGACGDTVSLDCDRAGSVTGVASSISAQLAPDVYWLVVDGATEASHGDFQLELELDPTPGECSSGVSPNSSCASALPLSGDERQLLLIDEACAPAPDGAYRELYYELDVSGEAGRVLLTAAAWTLSEAAFESLSLYAADGAAGSCGSELAFSYLGSGASRQNNAELRVLLEPGRYHLMLELDDEPVRRSALEVELDRETCRSGPRHNSCLDAAVIDPNLSQQVFTGTTACNTNQYVLPYCSDVDAPEQFFRLDLRSAPGPSRVRVTTLVDGLELMPILYLLAAAADESCGEALHCDDRIDDAEGTPHLDAVLDPGLYFIGVDGAEAGSAGAYQLLVELAPGDASPCVDAAVDECMFYNGSGDCCLEWGPACTDAVVACGLARATQDCLCATEPACCGPDRASVDCRAARGACGYLCPDFAPSEFTCLGL